MSKLETKTTLTPSLRFPEFSGMWYEKRLGDICQYKNGGSFENNVIEDGKYKLITLNSIDIDGNIKKEHKKVNYADWYLERNDLVMVLSDVAHGNFLGLVDIIPESEMYVLNQRMGLLRKKDQSIDLNFLRKFINFNQKYFKLHGQGSSQQNLSKGDIEKFNITYPVLQEQQKIASFLTIVDDWIENLKKQKEAQEKYKKGMMQKIFSQEIRFKDEDGKDYSKWEEKRLGEVAELFKGEGVSKQDIKNNGKYKCIRYGELYTLYSEQIKEVLSRTDIPFKRRSANNDVLMPTSDVTPTGLATASALSEENIILGGDILVIRSKRINNIFFSYYIGANKRDVMRLVNGVTVYHLYGSDMEKMNIKVPRFEEQQKIADFLSSIDDLINLSNQRITQAEEWKKGLMQRVFV